MADTQVAKRTDTTPTVRQETPLTRVLLGPVRKSLATIFRSAEQADAYLAEIFNMARRVPGLHSCTEESIAYGVIRFASLRLNPAIPNECWLIPRKGVAEPQYGYGGLRKLVMRSAEVIDCFSREVCENDLFETPETVISLPKHQIKPFAPRGRVIGYYNVLQKSNGNWLTLMMSIDEVLAHRDRYAQQDRSGQYGSAWSRAHPDKEGLTNFDKMGLKTVLRMNCSPRNVSLEAEVWEAIRSDDVDLRRPAIGGPTAMRPELPSGVTASMVTISPGTTVDTLTGELFGDSQDVAALRQAATGQLHEKDDIIPSSNDVFQSEEEEPAPGDSDDPPLEKAPEKAPEKAQTPAGEMGASLRAQIETVVLQRKGNPQEYLAMWAEELGTFDVDLSVEQLQTILAELRG